MKHQNSKISTNKKTQKLGRQITSSLDAYEVLWEDWETDDIETQESFKLVLLNNANRVKEIIEISRGGITGTLVDLRVLFYKVIKALSVHVILAHNHPSGNLNPSTQDKQLTQRIKEAAKLLDIAVLDHIIITPFGEYYSFADNCIL
ncbi:JAB domain-containing protein [Flagellimonas onchidii]|uniref:JAB domain-containing protein n=1 Tax=Flagellimonas onchidii TaxID=2562684 RepID=UPI0010A60776|nr:JAB domain-containing protein [Allomuricauda onchidii]